MIFRVEEDDFPQENVSTDGFYVCKCLVCDKYFSQHDEIVAFPSFFVEEVRHPFLHAGVRGTSHDEEDKSEVNGMELNQTTERFSHLECLKSALQGKNGRKF